MPSHEEAWKLLCEFTETESLRKHALAVEAGMRYYARKFGEDEEEWGLVGLIHDFDYEKGPEPSSHPEKGARILHERGWPGHIIRCILSHAEYLNVPRESLLEMTLFAVDELSGFISAVALVRPNKSIFEVDVEAVLKKMKQKSFAAKVNRQEIIHSAEDLGIPLDEHITNVIEAMKSVAGELGLAGTAPADSVTGPSSGPALG